MSMQKPGSLPDPVPETDNSAIAPQETDLLYLVTKLVKVEPTDPIGSWWNWQVTAEYRYL